MWQRTAIVFAVGLVWLPTPAARSDDSCYAHTLISELDWVQFDLVMGRILATGHRTKQDRQRAMRQGPDGVAESLLVILDRGLVSLHYEHRAQTRQLAMRVVQRDRLEIETTDHALGADIGRVMYVQAPEQDVVLSIESAARPIQRCVASSLWHLWLAYPELCQRHLEPLMGLFHCDSRIEADAQEIRAQLLDSSPWQMTTSRAEVERLVSELRESDFRARQRAMRELRARGPGVLAFLQELDPTTLDAEQRLRVRTIEREIIAGGEDTPARMASWLRSDKAAWLALLHDDSPAHRHNALHHLARLCERDLDFDPEATAAGRAAQGAALQAQLLRR